MKKIKHFFVFSGKQRNGVFILIGCIIAIQIVYFFVDFSKEPVFDTKSPGIALLQQEIDSLKQSELEKNQPEISSFNPNFITDHRGYILGMTAEEIDRLHQFRAKDQWINSIEDFKKVTQISDSLLSEISPYFKFPEWVTRPKTQTDFKNNFTEKSFVQKQDLNKAAEEQLQKIYGVGEVFSKRIIEYRSKFNGFQTDEQLYDVYGLESLVVKNILKEFTVKTKPEVVKININTASASDIATLPFINFQLAKEMVDYRLLHEGFKNMEELKKVKNFPIQKFDRFILYLTLE